MVKYISLGCNCSVKEQLSRNGINDQTLPFDWIKIKDFDQVIRMISNNFSNFMDNLIFMKNDDEKKFFVEKDKTKKSQIYGNNIATFYHDFCCEEDYNTQYEINKEKYQRRIERFYNILKSDEKIIFIRNDVHLKNVQHNILIDFDKAVKKVNKNIDYHIKWIIHPSKNFDCNTINKINGSEIIVSYNKPINWWQDEINWNEIFFS
ncbi:putative papain-like cysteine peptidase [Catovirus CTV1]|uniref:Putative papain-like cysteine peptidase n=1 Tax=Catovirus CTV1 TaxID=1977631 RepID=A0A1V0SAM1_9VIRU|nr:putative papain-like cysteine peptidase [Catovirus CTV1]